MRTPRETAILIKLLFKRANKTRARISNKTVLVLSKRKKYIRTSFLEMLTAELDDLGLVLIELERGGFGLIPTSALNGAPSITAKKFIWDDLKELRKGNIDYEDIQNEIEADSNTNDDEDEDEE